MTSPSAITRLAITLLCSASLVACGAKTSPKAELGFSGALMGTDVMSLDDGFAPSRSATSAGNVYRVKNGGDSTPPIVAMQQERKLIYTATLGLVVANTDQTRRELEEMVARFDGFLQRATTTEVVFRIAPEKFNAAIAEIEKLGEVTQRDISTDDVTDQYVDVNLRIEVAEKSRQRLLDLMDSARETKDIIEIERDIRRLTEEIELFEGQLRSLKDRIAFSTITVTLRNRLVDQVDDSWRRNTRFPWMTQVGIAETLKPAGIGASMYRRTLLGLSGPTFQLKTKDGSAAPEGFVPVAMTPKTLVATAADFSRLRVTTNTLRKQERASVDFWLTSLADEFQQNRGYRVTGQQKTNDRIGHLQSEVLYGGQQWLYDIWIAVEGEKLIVVEYTRLATNEDAERLETLKSSVAGMRF